MTLSGVTMRTRRPAPDGISARGYYARVVDVALGALFCAASDGVHGQQRNELVARVAQPDLFSEDHVQHGGDGERQWVENHAPGFENSTHAGDCITGKPPRGSVCVWPRAAAWQCVWSRAAAWQCAWPVCIHCSSHETIPSPSRRIAEPQPRTRAI